MFLDEDNFSSIGASIVPYIIGIISFINLNSITALVMSCINVPRIM